MIKISFGFPLWGQQDETFWRPLLKEVSKLYQWGIIVDEPLYAKSMLVDNNRNSIVHQFLYETKSEYLVWVDTDNSMPDGWLPRLLEHQKPIVGGIYFRRDQDHPTPIAYLRQPDGRYMTLPGYTRGEIIPVDAAGMNSMIIHRSVYEELEKNYDLFLDDRGQRIPIHHENIQGYVHDDGQDETDGQVIDGQLRTRLRRMPHDDGIPVFPFYNQGYGRTEDFPFYEMVARCGFQIWLDTSIECHHWAYVPVGGSHFRNWIRIQKAKGEWNE